MPRHCKWCGDPVKATQRFCSPDCRRDWARDLVRDDTAKLPISRLDVWRCRWRREQTAIGPIITEIYGWQKRRLGNHDG